MVLRYDLLELTLTNCSLLSFEPHLTWDDTFNLAKDIEEPVGHVLSGVAGQNPLHFGQQHGGFVNESAVVKEVYALLEREDASLADYFEVVCR